MRGHHFIAGLVALLGIVSISRAGDPFTVSVQTTSGTPMSNSVSGATLPDLISNVVNAQNEFSGYSNRDISASVKYGGLNNAIEVSKNAAGTSATLTIPSIGFTKTFTGTSSSDLKDQIINYGKKNGANIYGDFVRSINTNTDLGVTDGNPLATTAMLSNQAFYQFGLQPAPIMPGQGVPNPLDQVATANVRFDLNVGYSHTDDSSGYFAQFALSLGFKFGDRVGLVFSTPFMYRSVDGADVFHIGEEISLPILLIEPQGDKSFSWLVTPEVMGAVAGSYDLATGGTFIGGGATSSLSYAFGGFVFTLADQLEYFHGFPFSFSDYKFETNLDQAVLKNGVKVTKFFGDALFVDAGITYTQFLQHADIGEYWSPSLSIGMRLGPYSGIRLGYLGDFGKGYTVHSGTVELYFNY